MDLPYNLKGETWEVFKKRGVSLLGGIGSSQIAQLMEQQLELRGVDLQMQLDPNLTILPNMTDFDPRPFTIAQTGIRLVFRNRRATNPESEDQTEAFYSDVGDNPAIANRTVHLNYDVEIDYKISGSGKAVGNFSVLGTESYPVVITQVPRAIAGNVTPDPDSPKATISVTTISGSITRFSETTTLAAVKSSIENDTTDNFSLSPVLTNFVRGFNAPEEINRLIVNLSDDAIRQRTLLMLPITRFIM